MKCQSCQVKLEEEKELCDECEAEVSYQHACIRELHED